MNLKDIGKKVRIMVAGVAVLSSVVAKPVFADSEYGGRLIVPQTNNIPQFFIKRIDITNNQLEFALPSRIAQSKTVLRFGAGWVSDRSEPFVNADVRTYNLGDPGITTAFWSGDENVEDFVSSEEGGYYKTFTVDASIDLRHNVFKDMFYIVELTNGEVWMNKLNYETCGINWTMGKSCNKAYFVNDKLVDNVVYQLEDAPTEKFQRRYTTPTVEPEPVVEPEPIVDPEPVIDPEPTVEPEPVIEPEPVVNPEPTVEPEPIANSEPTVDPDPEQPTTGESSGDSDDEKPSLIANVASTVKYATDVTSDDVSDDNNIYNMEDDELTEANEGFGDTTLEVPELGGGVTTTKCDEFNFWPYLLFGFLGGIFLSSVLSLVKKANKVLSTN